MHEIDNSAGNSPVTLEREDIKDIPVPAGTDSWQPVSHDTVLSAVENSLQERNIEITGHRLVVSHSGARFFGTLKVSNPDPELGYIPTVGVRNAHDMRFAAGIAAGMQVLVCSNLSFSGDVVFKRKHTLHIMNDLPDMVTGAVDKLSEIWAHQAEQVQAYKGYRLSELRARHLTIEALDQGVISASRIPDILSQWREPSHLEFSNRNVWSWFNGVTEVLKKNNPFTLPSKTKLLHEVCDGFVGLN